MTSTGRRAPTDRLRPLPWIAAACLALVVPAARALELRGTIRLEEGKSSLSGREMTKVVVAFRPDGATEVEPSAEPLEMATINKEFFPQQLVVPLGSEVRFPNYDRILHNVFSVSGENQFDLGVYAKNDGKQERFETPGLVRVYCNVHRSMFAHILVLDTPYSANPDERGTFELSGVPAGSGTLSVWHPQSEIQESRVTLPLRSPLVVELDLASRKIPSHLNKFGRPYGRTRDRY
jgi:plastocyanin